VPVTLLDGEGEGLAEQAVTCMRSLGYTDVSILEGGCKGWAAAGGELFSGVNVPSKASRRHRRAEVRVLEGRQRGVVCRGQPGRVGRRTRNHRARRRLVQAERSDLGNPEGKELGEALALLIGLAEALKHLGKRARAQRVRSHLVDHGGYLLIG
jgi:hypothetical protein